MTYEEAIKHFIILRGAMKHNYDFEADMRYYIEDNPIELFNKSIEALKKADKYGWHDLRKNSDDLPNDFHTVLICINGFEGKAVGVSMAMHNSIMKVWGTESAKYKDYEVIAWREIEPFEVKV